MGSLVGFESLNDSKLFSLIYKEGKIWHSDVCVVFYKPSDDKKIAVVASKKVGKAVIRNKAKRRLRSAFVNVSSELENGVYIMVAKSGIDSAEFDKIQKNLKWSLKKLGCLK